MRARKRADASLSCAGTIVWSSTIAIGTSLQATPTLRLTWGAAPPILRVAQPSVCVPAAPAEDRTSSVVMDGNRRHLIAGMTIHESEKRGEQFALVLGRGGA